LYDDYKTGEELVKKKKKKKQEHKEAQRTHGKTQRKREGFSFFLRESLRLLCETPCNFFAEIPATLANWKRNGW
jgi:hypothetical protein